MSLFGLFASSRCRAISLYRSLGRLSRKKLGNFAHMPRDAGQYRFGAAGPPFAPRHEAHPLGARNLLHKSSRS